MKESFLRSIGASVVWNGLDRVAALAKHVVVAATIGLSAQLDVFYMAIGILGLMVFSWSNMLDVVGVPQLARLHSEGSQEKFDDLSRGLFTFSLLSACMLATVWWFGRGMIGNLALGFEKGRHDLLRDALAWMLPIVLLYLPMRQLGAFFRSTRRFSVIYKGEFLISLTMLTLVIVFRKSPHVLYWSFSAGVTVAFFFVLALGWKEFKLIGNPFSPAIWSALAIGPALLILQISRNAYVFVDKTFVSYLPVNAVGAFSYAWALVNLVPAMMIGTGGFVTVFSERQDDPEQANGAVDDILSMCLFIGIPTTAFCLLFGGDIVSAFLERGLFTRADSDLTARGLIGFSVVITPLLLRFPLELIYQVKRKMNAIVIRSLTGLFINVVLNGLFLYAFHWGVLGIALATSMAETIMVISALHGLSNLGLSLRWKEHGNWLLLLMGASGALALSLSWLVNLFDWKWKILPAAMAYGGLMFWLSLNAGRRESQLLRSALSRITRSIMKSI